jgi:hypothetical protein
MHTMHGTADGAPIRDNIISLCVGANCAGANKGPPGCLDHHTVKSEDATAAGRAACVVLMLCKEIRSCLSPKIVA